MLTKLEQAILEDENPITYSNLRNILRPWFIIVSQHFVWDCNERASR